MKEFDNKKTKEIVPRILGGLSIPSGVAMVILFVLSFPVMFIPSFKWIKVPICLVILVIAYSVFTYIDVSNNGIQNVFKKLFMKDIDGVIVKKVLTNPKKDNDS